MSLNKINNLKNNTERGFTIVELLIVIVVIGILAAITIVSYTGITQQATVAQHQQNASSIVNVAEIVYNTTGAYPTDETEFTNDTATLPAGISLTDPILIGAIPTTDTLAEPGANGAYIWVTCTTGVNVYFPNGDTSAPGVLKAGAGC